jgi:hypothetical protein
MSLRCQASSVSGVTSVSSSSSARRPSRLGFHGQSYPLFVGEPKPLSFELLLENTVLFDEIVDDRLLVSTEPAGQGDYEEVEGL